MSDTDSTQPSDIALARLRDLVGADKGISETIRSAVLADLDSDDPSKLKNMLHALAEEGKANAADPGQGS